MAIKIEVSNSNFNYNSSVVHTAVEVEGGAVQAQDQAILNELQQIQDKLDSAAELSRTIVNLETAIRAQDRGAISKIVQQVSTGFSASLLANLASGSLLSFLGM